MYFDGGYTIGSASYGIVICEGSFTHRKFGGKYPADRLTSNDSEFISLIIGMICCLSLNIKTIEVYGDSKYVIDKMNKKSRTSSPITWTLRLIAREISKLFDNITFNWIPRYENKDSHRETK